MTQSSTAPGTGDFLDADTPDTVRMTPAEAAELGQSALRSIGYSDEDAKIITDQLVDNALCGYRFASLPRILAIAIDEKTQLERRPVKVVHETPMSALLDGGNNVGYVSCYHATQIAIKKARERGFASVGVYDSYYSGRNAYFVDLIAREGFVAIHTASAKPRVLPIGGLRPAFGTNPLCIGFPSENGPVIFDMGTASIMVGEIQLFQHLGELLPEGIAFDAAGKPTRDPNEALKGGWVPFGGHKGSGLSLTIQALGLVAGAAMPRGRVQDFAFLLLVFDPGLLVPPDEFKAQLAELIANVRGIPRQPGVDEIRVPSERAFRERARSKRDGIVLNRVLYERIAALRALTR